MKLCITPWAKRSTEGILLKAIVEDSDKYSIHIKKGKESLPWKEFNKNMAIAVEFNLEY